VIDYFIRARVWKQLRKNGWFPLIVYEDMHFLKPLRHPRRFVVKSQFLGWDEERIIASHRFVRDDGVVVASGYTVARFVDRKGRAVPVPVVASALKAPSPPPLPAEASEVMSRSRAAAASLAGSA